MLKKLYEVRINNSIELFIKEIDIIKRNRYYYSYNCEGGFIVAIKRKDVDKTPISSTPEKALDYFIYSQNIEMDYHKKRIDSKIKMIDKAVDVREKIMQEKEF